MQMMTSRFLHSMRISSLLKKFVFVSKRDEPGNRGSIPSMTSISIVPSMDLTFSLLQHNNNCHRHHLTLMTIPKIHLITKKILILSLTTVILMKILGLTFVILQEPLQKHSILSGLYSLHCGHHLKYTQELALGEK